MEGRIPEQAGKGRSVDEAEMRRGGCSIVSNLIILALIISATVFGFQSVSVQQQDEEGL